MRKVTLISTNSGVSHVVENVPSNMTWGDFLRSADLPSSVLPSGDYEATVRETHNTLGAPSSILPEGDITIWLNPKRVKAGSARQTSSSFGAVNPARNVNVNDEVDRLLRSYQSRVDTALSQLRTNITAVLNGEPVSDPLEEANRFFRNA